MVDSNSGNNLIYSSVVIFFSFWVIILLTSSITKILLLGCMYRQTSLGFISTLLLIKHCVLFLGDKILSSPSQSWKLFCICFSFSTLGNIAACCSNKTLFQCFGIWWCFISRRSRWCFKASSSFVGIFVLCHLNAMIGQLSVYFSFY